MKREKSGAMRSPRKNGKNTCYQKEVLIVEKKNISCLGTWGEEAHKQSVYTFNGEECKL